MRLVIDHFIVAVVYKVGTNLSFATNDFQRIIPVVSAGLGELGRCIFRADFSK